MWTTLDSQVSHHVRDCYMLVTVPGLGYSVEYRRQVGLIFKQYKLMVILIAKILKYFHNNGHIVHMNCLVNMHC